jgi:hypothetical protein
MDEAEIKKKIPLRNGDVVWQILEGECVILNPLEGTYFGLNAVGLSFWEKVDGARTVGEITDLLLDEYEVDRATLARDILELVGTMIENNLLRLP